MSVVDIDVHVRVQIICPIIDIVTHTYTHTLHMHILSLLDILADRKDKSGLTGTVLVNGNRQPKNFKCSSGYVVQVGACIRNNLQ